MVHLTNFATDAAREDVDTITFQNAQDIQTELAKLPPNAFYRISRFDNEIFIERDIFTVLEHRVFQLNPAISDNLLSHLMFRMDCAESLFAAVFYKYNTVFSFVLACDRSIGDFLYTEHMTEIALA